MSSVCGNCDIQPDKALYKQLVNKFIAAATFGGSLLIGGLFSLWPGLGSALGQFFWLSIGVIASIIILMNP